MSDPSSEGATATAPRRINSGPGVVLLVVYVIFAISAGARAVFQLAVQFHVAPLAYVLSAFSAAVYIVAAVAIGRRRRTLALTAVWIELIGVVGIGLFTVLAPQDFTDATVWSDFGSGYGYVPLILPVLGLIWLFRVRES
ncbi:hypothetical protein [Actinomycetospora sp. TBRC 11914]|uniref:hypothetical protein n=1 Tax=Actinomycetospora sp. TBRC 11914 TaxID=2729387 RepID=UPI00145C70C2|nr:hypothetical protein [Actinomycetospora sp. TBRC 11914]NMO90718.1 hypothetical protein [Actinomycetospora sp. TBRC 11914]